LCAFHRSAHHATLSADFQVRAGLGVSFVFKSIAEGFNFALGEGGYFSVETHNLYRAGHLQHRYFLLLLDSHEDIAGKKRKLDLFSPVFPAMPATVERQKGFNAALFKLFGDDLFVARVRIKRIPVSGTLWGTCFPVAGYFSGSK